MVAKAKQFVGYVLPGVIKPLRILWNEMIGFVFLCLGIVPLFSAYRAWQQGDMFRVWLTLFFSAVMLYFGVTSFLKAKKIERS